MEAILISACLLGCNCKYNGGNNLHSDVIALKNQFWCIPVCPEQLGGLTTPRVPAERCKNKVVNNIGVDLTDNYTKGAWEALKIAQLFDCRFAIFKARSPSCGCGSIYDGTFSGTCISGNGTTTDLLLAHDITVYTAENFHEIFSNTDNYECSKLSII